eukprot:TRINITY_DN40191_c0_g1_i1.p1 TRINITY_DN40191_c0_g1~~TRINITY_DN40191_c0_g1_i1.p1  ORF type:complete len:101 (+),score=21.48 TRINITY_DN40191_c0_g1_i1:40-303(+)
MVGIKIRQGGEAHRKGEVHRKETALGEKLSKPREQQGQLKGRSQRKLETVDVELQNLEKVKVKRILHNAKRVAAWVLQVDLVQTDSV